MKKLILTLFIAFFVLFSFGEMFGQQNDEDQKFLKLIEDYFDAYWKFYPVAATMAGFHKYDNRLEDLDSGDLEKRLEALDDFNQELVTKVDRTKMSPDFQIDHQMLMDALDLERLRHEQLIPWDYDPLYYNTIFIHCVHPLLTEEFAPLEERAKNAQERLKNLPKLIKQAKENLKTPTQISTETAISQFPAIMETYRTELPAMISEVPEPQRSKLQSELAKVIPALEDYQNFLSNELLPKSTGNFRLGEAHVKLIRLTFQNTIPPTELVERAKADINNIRREMGIVCLPFYRIMYPDITIEQLAAQRGEEEARQIIIKGVLDKIKGEHVSKDEFIDKIRSIKVEIEEFLMEKDMVDLPGEELTIESMPPEYQGITWTRLSSPKPYETSGKYVTQITPIPDDWSEDQTNSFLEEFNNFMLYFYSVCKIYPGTFLPTCFTNQNPSLLRKLYPNKPLIKGWSIALLEPFILEGFGSYDLRLRLNQLKMRLKSSVDFLVEFQIHEGTWTKDQAVAYMMRVGLQTQTEAERKWNRILLFPGDAAYDYVGIQEIMDLEKAYKAQKGESFSQKEFLKELLSYGALPLRHMKEKILEQ
jgi:hypothetical protein